MKMSTYLRSFALAAAVLVSTAAYSSLSLSILEILSKPTPEPALASWRTTHDLI